MAMSRRRGVMSEEFKYELAKDLGFYDTVVREGWEGIRTKDAGNMVKRAIQIAEQKLAQDYRSNQSVGSAARLAPQRQAHSAWQPGAPVGYAPPPAQINPQHSPAGGYGYSRQNGFVPINPGFPGYAANPESGPPSAYLS
jgi:small acid-soluble spore protein F (minor alpha/beta-type SASP)